MALHNIDTTIPYLDKLIKLSNKDKLAIIASLSASMVNEVQESDNSEWENALSLEEFRTEAKARLRKIYGQG